MSHFISASACKGSPPQHLRRRQIYERPEALATLLKEREVARFLIAPDGFGKTMLAAGYAQLVFDFNSTFWIDAKSPCFVRDLDTGELQDGLLLQHATPALVVFDNVPKLDAQRTEAFSSVIDNLINAGCEVLVTLTPLADTFETAQADRLTLYSRDLLTTTAELTEHHPWYTEEQSTFNALSDHLHIPRIAWGGNMSYELLLQDIVQESQPIDVSAVLFIVFAHIKGSLELPALLGAACPSHLYSLMETFYTYTGLHVKRNQFSALELPVAQLVKAFAPKLTTIAKHCGFTARGEFLAAIAHSVTQNGNPRRACEIMNTSQATAYRASWLADNTSALFCAQTAQSASEVYQNVDLAHTPLAMRLRAQEALRLYTLGSTEEGLALARQVARATSAANEVRTLAALLMMQSGRQSEMHNSQATLQIALNVHHFVHPELSFATARSEESAHDNPPSPSTEYLNASQNAGEFIFIPTTLEGLSAVLNETPLSPAGWRVIAENTLALHQGRVCAATLWEALSTATSKPEIRIACAAQIVQALAFPQRHFCTAESFSTLHPNTTSVSSYSHTTENVSCENAEDATMPAIFSKLMHYLENTLQDLATTDLYNNYFVLYAAAMYEKARRTYKHQPLIDSRTLSFTTYAFTHMCAISPSQRLKADCAAMPHNRDITSLRHRSFDASPQDYTSTNTIETHSVPTLQINAFGGLDVCIGTEPINDRFERKRKVQILLTLLVANLGHEVCNARLAESLWPLSANSARKRNLYTHTKQLDNILTMENGRNVYLTHTSNGLRLRAEYVKSDIGKLKELYQQFTIDAIDVREWDDALKSLPRIYAGDLLPSEDTNDTILRLRDEYKACIVEALLAGSRRLLKAGENERALCFAREAYRFDRFREDVYIALMHAQLETNRRTSALSTYLKCRKFLSEELGLDPSVETVALYNRILEEEYDF